MVAPRHVAVIWQQGPVKGTVDIVYGSLWQLRLAQGKGEVSGRHFAFTSARTCRLSMKFDDAATAPGACAARVTVNTASNSFTFFLRDVNRSFPIFIAEYGVVVTEAADQRSFAAIVQAIRLMTSTSQSAALEDSPEETYEEACGENRSLVCPTWLGLSRDMRIFEANYQPAFGYWGYIRPRYHSTPQKLPETQDKPFALNFVVGPGASCRSRITRRLEDGVLPILHSTQLEDDIQYDLTMFATLEKQPLSLGSLRGSHWRACYPNTGGHMLQPDEIAEMRDLLDREMRRRPEETVCWVRIEAVNRGSVPRYAWFRGLTIDQSGRKDDDTYNSRTGFTQFTSGRVFGVHRLNGEPAPQKEMAILVPPAAKVVYEILVPHQPVSLARARKLVKQDFSSHLQACRRFWKSKLRKASSISIPEPAIDERVKAGLLHCDLVALGKEPDGPVLATIGWYSPIGSESSPIIQFFDAMGWHDLAERSLDFFLRRQRPDGFIQNFGGYQLETGPALWTMGEHYRYTRDTAWVRRVRPKVLKACDYLLAWRRRNQKPELRGKGYGLLDGKVADPEDFFRSFMLNGLSYLGIQRAGEMLAQVDPVQSKRLSTAAEEFRQDIRTAFYEAIAQSPAIPLSDGTWVPAVPPWANQPGALAVYAETGQWFTHGAFGARDSLIGSLYLVICEVLDADEIATDFLLKSHQQLFTVKNAGLSQPYYCRHDYIHLLRGEVKAFLKTYYNQLTALQDRETYTFWEHYWLASQHKTHEEAWFLMQTRWMLLMEKGNALHMLPGIPRTWMDHGKQLAFHRMKTYFGPVSLDVRSKADGKMIQARYELFASRKPDSLVVRLPHAQGLYPRKASGGTYCEATESVVIANPEKSGTIRLEF